MGGSPGGGGAAPKLGIGGGGAPPDETGANPSPIDGTAAVVANAIGPRCDTKPAIKSGIGLPVAKGARTDSESAVE